MEGSLKISIREQNVFGEMLQLEANRCKVNSAIKRIQVELGKAKHAKNRRLGRIKRGPPRQVMLYWCFAGNDEGESRGGFGR